MGSRPPRANKRGPRQTIVCLGVLTALWMSTLACGLVHSRHPASPGKLTADESAVQIFFKDQPLPCDNYIDLGHIQASSGEELEEGEKLQEYATFDLAIAWLKKEAHQRGASAVIVLDRKQSKEQASYLVTGIAIRCPFKPPEPPPPVEQN